MIEHCFRTINDERSIDSPITLDDQKRICLETLCFVHETGIYEIGYIMKELEKRSINYDKKSSNIAYLINYLYYLYTGKFGPLFNRWNHVTKDNLKIMIQIVRIL